MKVESPPQSFYLLNIVLIAFESQYEFFGGTVHPQQRSRRLLSGGQ